MRVRKSKLIGGLAAALALALTVGACSSDASSGQSSSTGSPTTQAAGGGSENPPASGTASSGDSPTGQAPNTAVSGEVTMWMYPVIADTAANQAFWDQTTKDFSAAYPNVKLTVQQQPWANRQTTISAALAANKGPDLVLLTPDMLAQFQAIGGLKPLTDAVTPDKDKFIPGAVAAATIDGQIYAMPFYQTVVTTLYNKKLFDQAGITTLPTTWDEVKADAPKLAKNGVAILDYSGSPDQTLNESFYPLLWQAGGDVFSQDAKSVAFDGPAGQAALQFLLDLKAVGGLPPDAATKNGPVEGSGLTTGKIAMAFAAQEADAETMAKAIGAENLVVGLPLTDKKQVTFGIPGLLARTKMGTNDAAVNAVAQFIGSAAQQTKLSAASGFFPARTDVPPGTGGKYHEEFAKALPFATAGPVNPKARQVMGALVPYLQSALQGKSSAADALAAAAKDANAIIGG